MIIIVFQLNQDDDDDDDDDEGNLAKKALGCIRCNCAITPLLSPSQEYYYHYYYTNTCCICVFLYETLRHLGNSQWEYQFRYPWT